jgi:hypothetical protein
MSGLIDAVTGAIEKSSDFGGFYDEQARAAVLAVADWLDDEMASGEPSGWAAALRAEVAPPTPEDVIREAREEWIKRGPGMHWADADQAIATALSDAGMLTDPATVPPPEAVEWARFTAPNYPDLNPRAHAAARFILQAAGETP